MSRIFALLLALLYSVTAFLGGYLTFGLHQLQRAIIVPALASTLVAILAIYLWGEFSALCRYGHSRFPLLIAVPLSLLLFAVAVALTLPHRRITANTTVLEDIRLIDAPTSHPVEPPK